MIREGFPEEVTFEQRAEGEEVASHADICGKDASGRRNSLYKGLEVVPILACYIMGTLTSFSSYL